MMEPFALMLRDLSEAPLPLVLLVLLPTVLSAPTLARGSRLGWIAPAILLGQVLAWYAYYATGAPNPGLGGAMVAILVPSLSAFAIATAALLHRPRAHA